MGEYTGDLDGIHQGAGKLGEATSTANQLPVRFEGDYDEFYGWWGVEGDGDDFADQVGPACRQEFEQVLETVTTITTGFTTLVDTVFGQAAQVRKPQDFALDSIDDQPSDPGDRR